MSIPDRYWLRCRICADALGYEDDVPRFATDRGLKRHLKSEHNVVENRRPRFCLSE